MATWTGCHQSLILRKELNSSVLSSECISCLYHKRYMFIAYCVCWSNFPHCKLTSQLSSRTLSSPPATRRTWAFASNSVYLWYEHNVCIFCKVKWSYYHACNSNAFFSPVGRLCPGKRHMHVEIVVVPLMWEESLSRQSGGIGWQSLQRPNHQ